MKITIYELLGLVKDGKAPKKIKYMDEIWEYVSTIKGTGYQYYSTFFENWKTLQNQVYLEERLNDEVEIIEEPNKIEKIEMYEDEDGRYFLNNRDKKIYIRCDEIDFMVDKFNELIDEINKLKEK